MMEAQRYPDDFDGIVAGAPALDFVAIGAQFIRDARVLYPDPKSLATPPFTPEQLTFVERKIVAACDGVDGVTDGIIDDPRACRVDLSTLLACPGDRSDGSCLTKA